jgi:hypothetical protein
MDEIATLEDPFRYNDNSQTPNVRTCRPNELKDLQPLHTRQLLDDLLPKRTL